MTNKTTSNREVGEDEQRKQILLYEGVRDYLRTRSRQESKTYSEMIEDWVPDDAHHEYTKENIVNIKAAPGAYEQVMDATGKRVKPGDVLTFYALLDALDEGHPDIAAQWVEYIPEMLWEVIKTAHEDQQ